MTKLTLLLTYLSMACKWGKCSYFVRMFVSEDIESWYEVVSYIANFWGYLESLFYYYMFIVNYSSCWDWGMFWFLWLYT